MKEFASIVLVSFVILVIASCATCFLFALTVPPLMGIGYALDQQTCEAITQDIGHPSRHGFWEGCQIQLEDGRWIPLDSYYYQERP